MSPVQMTKLPSDSNSYECENATSHHLRNLNAKYSVYVATSHSLWFCQCISLLYFIFVDENKHPRLLLWLKQRIEQAVVWTHSGFHVLCETSCLFLLKKTFGNTDYVDECTKWMEEKKNYNGMFTAFLRSTLQKRRLTAWQTADALSLYF